MLQESVLVSLGILLDFLALALKKRLEAVGVPVVVGLLNVGLPVFLDKVLEFLAIGSLWVGDVVVGKPAFKLSFVPLVVSCRRVSVLIS